jgi:hypothetical protein
MNRMPGYSCSVTSERRVVVPQASATRGSGCRGSAVAAVGLEPEHHLVVAPRLVDGLVGVAGP